ncbi:type II secretion system protein GspL [Dokdonella soli]|uniref:Type II secretion system protein L n=1 Tax=Dokdonella soli TaxID=529810 RepID=A0ABN1IVT4_9GAMM
MPDRLLLRLSPDGGLTWLRQAGAARVASASAPGLPPASALESAGEIVVLVPSEDVLLTEAKLSARNRAQLLQALPYAVEDQLLAPVEELHFAASSGNGDQVGVAVVARAKLRAWLDTLGAAGIRPDILIPDALALPAGQGRASALIEEGRAVVRLAAWSSFACTLAELPGWLAQAQAANALAPLTVHDFRAAPALALPVPVAGYQDRQRDPLAFLAAAFDDTASSSSRPWAGRGPGRETINLLEGEFTARHRAARGARWWRIAAALAAAVVVLAIANLGFDVLRLSRASARMDTLAQEAVHKAFPDIDAAQLARLSPEQLMRGRLDRLRGGAESSGLLRVLAQIAPVLGTNSPTLIQTRGMEYRNGTLELALRTRDVAMLDSVRERLATVPGLKAEVTAANPGADGVDGRIRINGSAP